MGECHNLQLGSIPKGITLGFSFYCSIKISLSRGSNLNVPPFQLNMFPYETAITHSLTDPNDIQAIYPSGLASKEGIGRNDNRKDDGNGCLVYTRKEPLPFHYEMEK